ncbi:GAF and ANTAR domain-containing protein [Kribbella sp. CA-293567]|nr:GAF and ANTAR domain-containing protein [Kribbella sp. CA-293567]WBQ03515.1 GAF and ANTAR domain-containing protein [Kribbella sp. CA-293567]
MRFSPGEPFAADAFARLALELHDAGGMEETVEAVVQFALQAESCAYAGVALRGRGGRIEIAAVTDPVVDAIYRAQIEAQDGPMVEAIGGRTVYVCDITATDQWPWWRAIALERGVGSVLHVPMLAAGQPVGVLSLYSLEPRAFSADDEAIAHILARHASVAVATARRDATMVQAVDARKLVGQAMGILMERFDLDADQAFAVLRRYSQAHNRKLRDVAQELIGTRRLPGNLPQRQ